MSEEQTEENELNTDEIISFVKEIGIEKFNEFKDSFKPKEEEKKEEPIFSENQITLITSIIEKAMTAKQDKPEVKKELPKRKLPESKPLNRIGNEIFGYI